MATGAIDLLVEVPLAIEETHADHRHPAVGRFFQQVPGQDTQAARVDGKGAMDAVFGAQEDHRPVGRTHGRGLGHLGPELGQQRVRPGH